MLDETHVVAERPGTRAPRAGSVNRLGTVRVFGRGERSER